MMRWLNESSPPIRVCPCGRLKENRGASGRQFVTTLGVLKVRRRYWQCRCGADGGYAADAVLGLNGRFSRVVQKHLCRLAADVSFAKAHDHLREMLGVSIATETVRMLVERHGKAMASFQPKDEATATAFRAAKGDVEFAVDAGKVNTREDGWKDLKIAVISKRESGPSSTPEQWADDRLPAATIVVAFAMIAASKVFQKMWRPTLKTLGITAFATVQALGDGASWIWKSVGRVLTGCTETLVYCAPRTGRKKWFGEWGGIDQQHPWKSEDGPPAPSFGFPSWG